ncbi:MAG: DUF3576 domain-containing protein [Pseudomonadota bacterium]
MRVAAFSPRLLVAAALIFGVVGCESLGIETREASSTRNFEPGDSQSPLDGERGSIFGDDGIGLDILGGGDETAGAQLPVNKYLWRGAIETLSFLPLTSTDPYGGVIISDWSAAPENESERFKVTTYITSAALKPQSLNVVVNRQTRSDAGQWVTAPVSGDTARSLEDAILTRARQLRSSDSLEEG